LLDAHLEQGRRLLLDGDYLRALPYLAEVRRARGGDRALDFLLARAMRMARIQLVVHEHGAPVRSAAFRAGDREILSVSQDGAAHLWDAATGRTIASLPPVGGTAPIFGHVATEGALAVLPLADGVVVWDGRAARTLPVAAADRVAVDAGGTRVAIAKGSVIGVWDAASGARLWGATLPVEIHSMVMTAERVVAIGNDRSARLLAGGAVVELAGVPADEAVIAEHTIATLAPEGASLWSADGRLERTLHAVDSQYLAVSADGARVAIGRGDGSTTVFDRSTGRAMRELHGHERLALPAFGPGGILATSGHDRALQLWDPVTGRSIARAAGARGTYIQLRFDHAGERILGASNDGTVRVFAVRSPDELRSIDGEHAPFYQGDVSSDGRRVVAADSHGVQIWALEDGRRLARIEAAVYDAPALDRDGSRVAIPLTDGGVAIHELPGGARLRTIAGPAAAACARFDPAGERLAVGRMDGGVEVWSIDGERLVATAGHDAQVWMVDVDRTAARLTSASFDRTARVWDLTSGEPLERVEHADIVTGAIYDADHATLATGSMDATAKLWRDGKVVATLQHDARVMAIAISEDGTLAVTGSSGGVVSVWDVGDSTLLAELRHVGPVGGVELLPDDDRLLTIGGEGRIVVWDLSTAVDDATVRELLHCHVPFELHETVLHDRELPDCL
jgi:WD40 repeat protein